MCILFVYTNPNPEQGKYQLVLATNRDEYFIRPAEPAHRWPEDEDIIAGKDLEPGREGGTWFGVSFRRNLHYKLRAAALLNVTGEPRNSGAAGRGQIVTDYLRGDLKAEDYIQQCLKPNAKTFNAFSFVAVELGGDAPRILHYTNVTNLTIAYSNASEATVIGFGNSPPHEPLAKVLAGQRRFHTLLSDEPNNNKPDLARKLRTLLRWDERHLPDEVLSRRAPDTFEHLSSVFVNVPVAGYGTRTHTLLLVDADGRVDLQEETMRCPWKDGMATGEWDFNSFQANL